MAPTILLIFSFIAVTNADYVWVDEESDAPQGYKRMYVPPLPQPPPLPGFGQLPPLPQPPPLYVPDLNQGFQHFQPNFVPINIPSPADIKNTKPAPGQVFNGVSVKSVSGVSVDKDGNIVKTGGTTFVVNDNGEVKETKVGKNPPNIEDPFVFPTPHFQMPKIPDPVTFEPITFKPIVFKPFKPITFKPITFEPITFDPITFKPIDMNYKPADGENYVAVSHSSHVETSNIDGVVSNSGGSSDMVNVNGNTDKELVEFRNDPENQTEEAEHQNEE